MENLPAQILLQILFILLNAFFAGSEIAFLSLNSVRLSKLAEGGDRTAARLLALVENPNRFLSAIQIAITLSGFLGAAFGTENFSGYLSDFLSGLGLPLPTASVLSMVAVTLVISFFSIAFGEMVPKRIAMQQPERWARVALGVMGAIRRIFAPMMALLDLATNGTLRLFGLKTEAGETAATEEEIRLMVENSSEQGTIAQEEQQWIENVFDFGDLTAADVMTPEPEVCALPVEASPQEVLAVIRKMGYSRYPVYRGSRNEICGMLNARDFLLCREQQALPALESLLRPVYAVPEHVHADQLFRDMQARKHPMAVVVDEYGGTAGIVTMEDLLEEIVGNIYDEFDEEEPQPLLEVRPGVWQVAGSLRAEELAELLGVELPPDADYDTVNGMVMSCLPAIPRDGTRLAVETCGLRIQVQELRGRRVVRAEVEKLPANPPDNPPA